MAHRSRDVIDERDYLDVRVRERERDVDRDPLSRYFQEDRRSDSGALVLRQREVETVERPRQRARSPSPVRYREVIRERSPSPLPPPREREVVDRVEVRERVYDRERERDRYREPSRGPQERIVTRVIDRERQRSPTPSPERDHERIRIIERSRGPSPSPSPPPQEQRQLVRGPVVEREVITHYTDVDHGVVYAPRAPPRPEPRRERERERDTEIDIYSSRHRTEVDIQDRERRRSRSRSRLRAPPARASEKEVIVRSDRHHLEVDIDERRSRRSRSAQPPTRTERRSDAVADEARYIERRIDDRGRMGEAYNGATKDWTIIDVPPGTEHVRMDGVGGASADVTWQRYNGVRRTRFIPEREGEVIAPPRRKRREAPRERSSRGEHINIQVVDQKRSHSRDREIEVETDQRMVLLPATHMELVPAARSDMWTEITKDLVSREALDYLGYDYQETEYFYYILQYLRYEDVQELVQLSDRIRRQRHKEQYSEVDIDIDVKHKHNRRSHSHHRPRREDERYYEREVVVDHLHPGYYR
ncbi:hypothetical protein SPBR_05794 [Sporothrix brasiliensis 5110]|uniref:DUF8035 domain-containing protein n=1 Tax=Sporothrix brasiliensis 5110 TaxID=1398154 RepID=A0A0C2J6G4_9PEZI|nr:uncharacterized protein SPBR_05794 [Sporothrix brasiliensis 5110]KIH94565.1 hypothetical protein SPBR_05794 [Sporothrix brasiliensis 5110]